MVEIVPGIQGMMKDCEQSPSSADCYEMALMFDVDGNGTLTKRELPLLIGYVFAERAIQLKVQIAAEERKSRSERGAEQRQALQTEQELQEQRRGARAGARAPR